MRLHDLLTGSVSADGVPDPGIEFRGDPEVEIGSLVIDDRVVTAGACFACVPGVRHDGHDHAAAAVRAGAVACVVERWLDLPVPQIRVPSVRAVLGPLASRLEGDPSRAMTVVGVTGTNGKTTTAALVEAIAGAAGRSTGVIGTIGTRYAGTVEPAVHTTPEAPDLQALLARMRRADVRIVAMEISSHALSQHRVDGTRFEIGRAHV